MSYSVINVDEIEGEGPNGVVKFVRRQLGVQAFGITQITLPPDAKGVSHDEAGTGQEEVVVVVAGSGHWHVGDAEEVAVKVGSFIRFDPETVRLAHAGPDGMTYIGIGARRGSYEPQGPF